MEDVDLIGSSAATQALREDIELASRNDSKVLITGESGVGKEIAARLIHKGSQRCRAPLVTINCAALTDSLLESELFGHERGSFTGAYRDRVGLLELAHRGTVFMDEIGEMSLRMQGLLLRFMETGEIQRVGSTRAQARVDVRVIAATNRNLSAGVAAKTFRDDLFYRLNVVQIRVAPLRERPEDIPDLLKHFLQEFGRQYSAPEPVFAPDAMFVLARYEWPGNVRELKNLVERIVVGARSGPITVADLPREVAGGSAPSPVPPAPRAPTAGEVAYDEMVMGGQSFWQTVYPRFMARDMTRDDLRQIVSRGLEGTAGSYKQLIQLFNMEAKDYKRFLAFLRKHECQPPYRQFRNVAGRPDVQEPGTSRAPGWRPGAMWKASA